MLNLDKSDWTSVRFGDVVTNVSETVKEPSATGIDKVIALDHLDPGKLVIARYGDVADGTTFTRRVRPGQTLFGKRRAYQRKAAYSEVDAICSGDILVLEADSERLSPRLLPFLVHSEGFFDHALGTSAGSLSPRTSWKALAKYEVDLPPLENQERIADLLWRIEHHKSHLKELQRTVDAARKALVQTYVRGLAAGSLSEYVRAIEAGRSPKAEDVAAGRDSCGVLKVSAVGKRDFLPSENKRLFQVDDFSPEHQVRAGDLLVTRANAIVDNVARACLVLEDHPNLMLSDKTLRLVPRQGSSKLVLLELLSSPRYRRYVRSAVGGTGAKNISQRKLLAGPIPRMSQERMTLFEAHVARYNAVDRYVATELAQAKSVGTAISTRVFA
ncbi:MAG: restriction endonuclease subunit S [Ornithinimicrobium sp.]